MNPLLEFSSYIKSLDERLDRMEQRLSRIESLLQPQLDERERQIEEERKEAIKAREIAIEQYKKVNLVCIVDKITLFFIDIEGRKINRDLEVMIRYPDYECRYRNNTYVLDYKVGSNEVSKDTYALSNELIELFKINVVVIIPDEECRKTWKGKSGDKEIPTKIKLPLSVDRERVYLGIKIRANSKLSEWVSEIFIVE